MNAKRCQLKRFNFRLRTYLTKDSLLNKLRTVLCFKCAVDEDTRIRPNGWIGIGSASREAHTKNNVDRVCFGGVFPLTAHLCRSTFHETKKFYVCPVVTLWLRSLRSNQRRQCNKSGRIRKINKKKWTFFSFCWFWTCKSIGLRV